MVVVKDRAGEGDRRGGDKGEGGWADEDRVSRFRRDIIFDFSTLKVT